MTETAASKALAVVFAILGNVLILVILALAGAVAIAVTVLALAPAIMKLV